MAWASVNVYNMLERWKKRLIQQPYEFQQVNSGYSEYAPIVWIQQERDELALVIKNEINHFNFWVGYAPFPTYYEEIIYLDEDKTWYDQPIHVSKSLKLIEFGQENKELLGTANISYSGDLATISFVTTEVTDGRLAVLFNSSDTPYDSGDLRTEIHDLSVSYSGGAYSITGHKSLFVIPNKQLDKDSFVNGNPEVRNKLDKNDNTNFATTVDMYRVYNDDTTVAKLLSIDYTNNTLHEDDVTPIITNHEYGEFYISSDGNPSFLPYAVKVYYKAGEALQENGNVFSPFESIIIRRAKVNLPINVDELAYRTSAQWQKDSLMIGETTVPAIYYNPIGDKRIDYETWLTYQQYHSKFGGQAVRFVGRSFNG